MDIEKAKQNLPRVDLQMLKLYYALHPPIEPISDPDLINQLLKDISADKMCHACGQTGIPLKICQRCHLVYYCNLTCQKQDWAKHKLRCGDVEGPADQGPAALVILDDQKDVSWIRIEGTRKLFMQGSQTRRQKIIQALQPTLIQKWIEHHPQKDKICQNVTVTFFLFPSCSALLRTVSSTPILADAPKLHFLSLVEARRLLPTKKILYQLVSGQFAVWIGVLHVKDDKFPVLIESNMEEFALCSFHLT